MHLTKVCDGKYRCSACHKFFNRKSDKMWIKSYCSETGRNARLILVWSEKQLKHAKQEANKIAKQRMAN